MSDSKVCPREPTPEMNAAGFAVPEAEHDPAGVWRAMYDAAPPQADAEALMRELVEAVEGAVEDFERLVNARIAARAYLATKDAP